MTPEPARVSSAGRAGKGTAVTSGIGSWAGLSGASKRLIAVGGALLLAMVAVVGIAVWNMRVVALDTARQNEAKLGIAIAEQTTRSMQAIDLIVQQLRGQVAAAGIASPSALLPDLQNEAVQQELAQFQHSLPQVDAFTILDATGRLVNFSHFWPIPHTSLADRDYFQHFLHHDDRGVFISGVMRSRVTGTLTFYVARRLDGPQGQFMGVVLGAVDLSYFRDFYHSLTSGGDLTVALLDRNGQAVLTYPTITHRGGWPPRRPAAWYKIVNSGRPGVFEAEGQILPG